MTLSLVMLDDMRNSGSRSIFRRFGDGVYPLNWLSAAAA